MKMSLFKKMTDTSHFSLSVINANEPFALLCFAMEWTSSCERVSIRVHVNGNVNVNDIVKRV
jgi:hypothetical protein